MIDQIAIAHIVARAHRHRQGQAVTTEQEFYAQFGPSPLRRIAGWLACLDLNWKTDRTLPARSPDERGSECCDNATLLPSR